MSFFLKGHIARSKGLVPTDKPYHKEYSCDISKLQHLLFKQDLGLFTRFRFSKKLANSKVKVTG